MDDLELIAEDKELGVKRSAAISRQPFLPLTMSSLLKFDERPHSRKTTSSTIVNACTATMSPGNRSIMSDVLQVYHFFRGDVGYSRIFPSTVPNFSLKHLLYAVNEVMIMNAKKSQLIPPLISQLFYTALKILTDPHEEDWELASEDEDEKKKWKVLKQDLTKLGLILNEASWGQTLMCYIDLMDRFYSSDATLDPNALPGYPITLVEENDESDSSDIVLDENTSEETENEQNSTDDNQKGFVDGYHGYIGSSDSAINKGYTKLLRYDPWYLTAEELIAMLRVLTDDILAMKANMGREFAQRDEESMDLLRAKKAAESNFRKIRLAYEGPKWPSKAKTKKAPTTDEKNGDNDQGDNEVGDTKKDDSSQKKFKPTATKKQFEEAEKARNKAIEQYEKGLKTLTTRTEAIGYDRNYNTYYFFHHDPDMIHVEMNRSGKDEINQIKSWSCIDHKCLFDDFLSSLDTRGIRESALAEAIGGNGGANMRRHLSDSNKKNSLILARKREEEDFERRLNNALIASADQGRRSGRLANSAKGEVTKIEREMVIAKEKFEEQLAMEDGEPDYYKLTGIETLSEFEAEYTDTCFSLFCEADSKTSGIVHIVASKMLDLEYLCEKLDPWERNDLPRAAWISNVKDIAQSYERGNHIVMGTKLKAFNEEISPAAKRQRKSRESTPSSKDPVMSSSLVQVISALKNPLIELEERIYSIIGLEKAVDEVDDANDNLSVGSSQQNEISDEQKALEKAEKIQFAWKKKINSLKFIPTKRASAIREVLISAILIARKGNLEDVLLDLRSALNLHRPGAAGRARQMALSVLEKYGGFDVVENGDELLEDEDTIMDSDDEKDDDEPLENISYLCGEAMMLVGCLEGDNNADRVDWRDAVNDCKIISRFAALVSGLVSRAMPNLQKLSNDRNTLTKALKYWEAGTKTRKSRSQKNKKEKYNSTTEIWTSTNQTDEFVLGKVEGYPWWPARVCVAKDPKTVAILHSVGRVLISFIGEQHLHVVKRDEEIRPFAEMEDKQENIEDYPTDVIKKLRETTAMARRIIRGKNAPSDEEKNFIEEKKSSI